MNAPPAVAPVPSGLVTATSTVPAACAGVVAEIEVAEMELTVAATPPNVTVAPDSKPLPEIATEVPPAVVPDEGEIPVMLTVGFGE